MLSPGQITKPNDAIESQKIHPSIPQDKNVDTMEASKEEGVNLYRVNDTPSGKQSSPYYSSLQPNSFLSPDTFDFRQTTPGTGNGEFLFENLSDNDYDTLKPQTATSFSTQSTMASSNYMSQPTSINSFAPLSNLNKDVLSLQPQGDDDDESIISSEENDEQSKASDIRGEEQPELLDIENMTPHQLRDELFQARKYIQQLAQENQKLIEKLTELCEENKEIRDKLNKNASPERLKGEEEKINKLNTQIKVLEEQLKAKDDEIAQLKQQQPNARVEELEKKLAAKNTEVQKLQKENKELEAQKQPNEQPKPGKASIYAAYATAIGVGLAAGLAVYIALEYTAKLEMLVTVGIAVASALAVGGITYFALKPSTQVSETQEPQNAVEGCCKV